MSKYSYIVLSLYKFFEIKKIFNFKNQIASIFKAIDVKGIILIAPEGININISVIDTEFKNVEKKLNRIFQYKEEDLKKNIATKHSCTSNLAFNIQWIEFYDTKIYLIDSL